MARVHTSDLARSAFAAGCLASLLLVATSARAASENNGVEAHEGEHLVLGVKAVSTVERASGHGEAATLSGYGFAGVAETTLFHERMALELDLVFTAPGDELSLATEPLAKLPWHLTSWLEPYAAAGPMLLRIHDDHGARFWLGGGQLVLGAFVWLSEMAGLDLDVAVGAARGPEQSMVEMTFSLGPVLRD